MSGWTFVDLSRAVESESEAKAWLLSEGRNAAAKFLGTEVFAPFSCSIVTKRSGVVEPIRFSMVGRSGVKSAATAHLYLSGWSGIAFVSWKGADREVQIRPKSALLWDPSAVSVCYRDPRPDGADLSILQAIYAGEGRSTEGAKRALLLMQDR